VFNLSAVFGPEGKIFCRAFGGNRDGRDREGMAGGGPRCSFEWLGLGCGVWMLDDDGVPEKVGKKEGDSEVLLVVEIDNYEYTVSIPISMRNEDIPLWLVLHVHIYNALDWNVF
jgi:hypothetical protein